MSGLLRGQARARPGRPLWRHLAAFGLALSVPAFLLTAGLGWSHVRAERRHIEAAAEETAHAGAIAIDRDLGGLLEAGAVLASDRSLRTGDLNAFEEQAREVRRLLGVAVVLRALDGQHLVNTRLPPGAALPSNTAPDSDRRVLERGEPDISDIIATPLTDLPVVLVNLPVWRDGQIAYLLNLVVPVQRLRDMLARLGVPPGWAVTVLDRRGTTVLGPSPGTGPDAAALGAGLAGDAGRPGGSWRGTFEDRGDSIAAWRRSAVTGWVVLASAPAALAEAPLRRVLASALVVAAVTAALVALLAWLFARRIAGPLEELAGAVAGGQLRAARTDTSLREVNDLAAALAAGEARLRSVFDTVAEGILVAAEDGALLSANPGALRIFGYEGDAAALLRGGLGTLLPPEERGRLERRMASLDGTGGPPPDGTPDLLLLGRRRDGTTFPMELSVGTFEADGRRFFTGVVRDVGARVAAEEALRLREAEMARVLEATSDAVLAVDAGWRITLMNRHARAQFAAGADLRGRLLWDAFPGTAGGGIREACRRCMADRVPTEAEQVYAPHGRHVAARAFPSDGGGVTVFLRDLTEERAAARRLAESEAQLRAVLENVPVGVLLAEAPSGRMLLGNRRIEQLLRHPVLPSPDIAAYRDWEGYHPDGRRVEGSEYPLALALAGDEAPVLEFRYRRGDGTFTWLRANAAPVRDDAGAVIGAVAAITDIDAERQASAMLRESEARWRSLAEAMPQLVWTCRPDGYCEYFNRRWEQYTGVPSAQHLGEGWLDVIHPEDRDRLVAAWRETLAGGPDFDTEVRMRGADGCHRWFKKRAVALRGRDGEVLQWFGTSTDVTDAVAARDVLSREAAQLERLAEERGRALADSEARLAEAARMEALGRLAGGVAHDFNNVLQAVQGGLTLAGKRLTTDPGAARHYLGLAAEAAARGASVTGRLLSFARRSELRAEPIAPAPLLAGVADMLRHALGPGITLRVDAAADLPALVADRGQLDSVLVNLANNARDAMPGGGALTFAAAVCDLPGAPGAPPGLRAGCWLRLSVTDEGTGMTPEVLARVTEPFFTTKPRGKGTGLGLAMARGFAEQSGGALSIDSAPGRGTTVSLWLPCAGAASAERPPGAVPEAPTPAQGVSVLVVEDDADVRAVLAAELAERGYAVTEAPDGPSALALVDGGLAIDALVTDFAMPGGMDGLALVVAVRQRRRRLPAVLVTGHAGDAAPAAVDAVDRSGPFALLRKPARGDALAERLALVLRRASIGIAAAG
ncbi:PAS domain S-box protein [Falsiroseomonas sp. CW058]|uniref:PAS domain S-box protein n=1 Tax=Falsiroseomonas sp. CW058 TaxID=3388664 RepID=UPI003D320770